MSNLTDAQIQAALAAVETRYEPRILALLTRIAEAFRVAGRVTSGPTELAIDGSPSWSIIARVPRARKEDLTVDTVFEIAEALEFGGGPRDGLNFGLRSTLWGGQPLATFEPFNFTPEVWVSASDAAAVEKRFRLVEGVDAGAFVGATLAAIAQDEIARSPRLH
jgi:hypothetical protein